MTNERIADIEGRWTLFTDSKSTEEIQELCRLARLG